MPRAPPSSGAGLGESGAGPRLLGLHRGPQDSSEPSGHGADQAAGERLRRRTRTSTSESVPDCGEGAEARRGDHHPAGGDPGGAEPVREAPTANGAEKPDDPAVGTRLHSAASSGL